MPGGPVAGSPGAPSESPSVHAVRHYFDPKTAFKAILSVVSKERQERSDREFVATAGSPHSVAPTCLGEKDLEA